MNFEDFFLSFKPEYFAGAGMACIVASAAYLLIFSRGGDESKNEDET